LINFYIACLQLYFATLKSLRHIKSSPLISLTQFFQQHWFLFWINICRCFRPSSQIYFSIVWARVVVFKLLVWISKIQALPLLTGTWRYEIIIEDDSWLRVLISESYSRRHSCLEMSHIDPILKWYLNFPYLNLKTRRSNQVFHKILTLDLQSIFKNTFVNHSVTSVNQVHSSHLFSRLPYTWVALSKIPQNNASLISTLV